MPIKDFIYLDEITSVNDTDETLLMRDGKPYRTDVSNFGGTETNYTGVSENGTQIVVDAKDINFTTSGAAAVSVADDGDSTVTVTISATNTTYVASDFNHDDLANIPVNDHIDWTATQTANIHADNYTNTTYTAGTGLNLSGTEFLIDNTVTQNTDADISANTWVLDEDDFISNSATKVSTQQSTKAYFDNNTTNLQRIHLKKSSGTGESIVQGEASEIEIGWDAQEYYDSAAFTHSVATNNHQITVVSAGVYRIIANICYENSVSSARNTPVTYFKRNGVTVDSTKSADYDRGASYGKYSNCKVVTTVTLAANDIASIGTYAYNEDGTLTITDTWCELIIERLSTQAVSDTWRPALSAGTGINIISDTISNSDTGSDAVTTHESTYNHDNFISGLTAVTEVSFASEYSNGTVSTNTTIDWANGNNQLVTLSANITLSFSNMRVGHKQLRVIQDSTGGRTPTLPTGKWPGGTAGSFSTAANAEDILSIFYNGTSYYYQLSKGWA